MKFAHQYDPIFDYPWQRLGNCDYFFLRQVKHATVKNIIPGLRTDRCEKRQHENNEPFAGAKTQWAQALHPDFSPSKCRITVFSGMDNFSGGRIPKK